MRVQCTNDDWSDIPTDHPLFNVLTVGDPVPVKGGVYEVDGYLLATDREDWGYSLAEFDFSLYTHKKIFFKTSRFEIVDDAFIPNTVTPLGLGVSVDVYISGMLLPFIVTECRLTK